MKAPSAQESPIQRAQYSDRLISSLTTIGPRYTSYPTADRFSNAFGYRDYLQEAATVRDRCGRQPLSLYLHIPFCESVCYYCACNKIVTRNRDKATTYLAYLKREITLQATLLGAGNDLAQLHFGGGTPTYLSDAQLADLMAHVRRCFHFAPENMGEYSIEIDPRTVSRERIENLRALGFNRISIGVQDFDPDVQAAVNRRQDEADTVNVIAAAREAGFRSISVDLIYGLPAQTLTTMETTLAKVVAANPDRIALYHYAHLPHLFKPQRRIAMHYLPDTRTKLDMQFLAIRTLTEAGYVYIGMDHFAKPDDALAIAQRQGRLHRNFQGYSTHAGADLLSCGVSAISALGLTYSQNVKTLDEYYECLDRNELPIARGLRLGMDDIMRRLIIQMLMCNFELSIRSVEIAYPVRFNIYFAPELEKLRKFSEDELLNFDDEWITVTSKGRLLIRNICMVFDRYLSAEGEQEVRASNELAYARGAVAVMPRYSRTV